MTLEESRERLRQLGVMLPVIEGDYMDEDIAVAPSNDTDDNVRFSRILNCKLSIVSGNIAST